MLCPTCKKIIPCNSSVVSYCKTCEKALYDDKIMLFWKGFVEGRNKKNTMEVCSKVSYCDIDHDACPSRECDSFVDYP